MTQLDTASVSIRGIHRLAGAVLVQAIEDVRSGYGKRREEALRWMNDPSDSQFSFIFCCRLTNRNPQEVRRFLQQQDLPAWYSALHLPEADSLAPAAP